MAARLRAKGATTATTLTNQRASLGIPNWPSTVNPCLFVQTPSFPLTPPHPSVRATPRP